MKLLFCQWHSFMNQGIERALVELGITYDIMFYQFGDWEQDDTFAEKLTSQIKNNVYDKVFSVNFSPLISKICEEMGLLYISWIYDSPLHIRDTSALGNSCNRIYSFDRGWVEEQNKAGILAEYLPLAVDTEVFEKQIRSKPTDGYQTDISLVGKLYQTEYNYFTGPLDMYLRGYLEGILNAQTQIYGAYIVPELVTDKLLEQMNQIYMKASDGDFCMGRRELEYLLACEVTGRERYLALSLLSAHYQVDLYSTEKDERLKLVKYKGYADYYTQMPNIFANSKINLNISLRTIRTGIPLRVIDVMGCGGFLLTNYQVEIPEYFEVGRECVIYENMEDLFCKAKFYLEHESERRKIAQAGYERVKCDFTFKARLQSIL